MRRERCQGYLRTTKAPPSPVPRRPHHRLPQTRQVAERQRKAVVKRIAERAAADGEEDGKAEHGRERQQGGINAELLKAGWPRPSSRSPTGERQRCRSTSLEAVASHPDAALSARERDRRPRLLHRHPQPQPHHATQAPRDGRHGKPYYVTPGRCMPTSTSCARTARCTTTRRPPTGVRARLEALKGEAAGPIVKRLAGGDSLIHERHTSPPCAVACDL